MHRDKAKLIEIYRETRKMIQGHSYKSHQLVTQITNSMLCCGLNKWLCKSLITLFNDHFSNTLLAGDIHKPRGQ